MKATTNPSREMNSPWKVVDSKHVTNRSIWTNATPNRESWLLSIETIAVPSVACIIIPMSSQPPKIKQEEIFELSLIQRMMRWFPLAAILHLGFLIFKHSEKIPYYHILLFINLVSAGFWLYYVAFEALPGSSFLLLSAEGFTISWNYRKEFHPWSSVESFGTTKFTAPPAPNLHQRLELGLGALWRMFCSEVSIVGFNYLPTPDVTPAEVQKRLFMKSWFGYDDVISGNFGQSANRLVEALNRFKQRHEARLTVDDVTPKNWT